MKGNEGQKGQKLQNASGLAADKICLNLIRKRSVFGNLWGGPHVAAPASKKWKEMKAQKAKMKGNEGQKGQKLQNAAGFAADKKICLNLIRKRTVFGNLQGGASRGSPGKQPKRPKWKEMATMKGNEGPKGQNERTWRPKKPKIAKCSRFHRW